MKFTKYHALGNDYVVSRLETLRDGLVKDQIERICHRNYGIDLDQ